MWSISSQLAWWFSASRCSIKFAPQGQFGLLTSARMSTPSMTLKSNPSLLIASSTSSACRLQSYTLAGIASYDRVSENLRVADIGPVYRRLILAVAGVADRITEFDIQPTILHQTAVKHISGFRPCPTGLSKRRRHLGGPLVDVGT